MTRQEFLDDITSFDQLRDFCYDIDYDLWEDGAYSEDEYDDRIDDDLCELVRHGAWREVRDYLTELPDGYDFYFRDEYNEWLGRSSDDIDDLKDRVYEYAMDNELFDSEDEEDEEEEEEAPDEDAEDDDSSEIEECDIDAFIWGARSALEQLRDQSEKEEAYANQVLSEVLSQLSC